MQIEQSSNIRVTLLRILEQFRSRELLEMMHFESRVVWECNSNWTRWGTR